MVKKSYQISADYILRKAIERSLRSTKRQLQEPAEFGDLRELGDAERGRIPIRVTRASQLCAIRALRADHAQYSSEISAARIQPDFSACS
jgi:hypothetical protein